MYLGLIVTLTTGVLLIAALRLVATLTAVARDPVTVLPFQSGFLPSEHALSRYHPRWYVASVVFLAFDVETLFMYPWTLVVADRGASSVVEMFAFLGALLLAVVWARREGAFRWV